MFWLEIRNKRSEPGMAGTGGCRSSSQGLKKSISKRENTLS